MPFGSLWLPVVVSAVVVFFGSWLLHMILKYHKADFRPLPGEDAVRDALARANPSPGVYMTPHCSDHKQMQEPAMREKFEKGPVAIMTVYPKGMPNMGMHLGLWFGFTLVVSFLACWVVRHSMHAGDDATRAGTLAAVVAFGAYGASHISDSIWKGQPWANTIRALIDGVIYAGLTGATFCLLFPGA